LSDSERAALMGVTLERVYNWHWSERVRARAEPLPEGTRRRLSRGGARGTDAEIGMQTTSEPRPHLNLKLINQNQKEL
jgi:hypothetical protein